jgi:hypothetical protein
MNDTDSDHINFKAIFNNARTVIDGGLRISLDLTPDQAQAMVDLIRLQGRILEVAIIPHPKGTKHV